MERDEIIELVRQAELEKILWRVDLAVIRAFAKLVDAKATAKEREAWRNAAIRVGENLATCGPVGYYDFTAQQWLDWALDATTKMQHDYMNFGACGEREQCAEVCESVKGPYKSYGSKVAKECADAIRARAKADRGTEA